MEKSKIIQNDDAEQSKALSSSLEERAKDEDRLTLGPNCSQAHLSPQVIAALAAALGGFCAGSFIGWSSSVQPQLQHNATTENGNVTSNIWHIHLTVDEMSWISSLLNIGALIGSLTAAFLMDKFGRKALLMASIVPYVIGWFLITLSVHPSMLYIGRLLGGIGAGCCSVAGPCYTGELSTPKMRGTIGMFFPINITLGVVFTSLLVWLDWRWISGVCAIQPFFFGAALFFMPESPYFLLKQGHSDEARKTLLWLRGPNHNIETELNEFKVKFHATTSESFRFSDILLPSCYKPILIGVAMTVFSQFSGFITALFYTVEIFRAAGSSLDPRVCSIITKTVMLGMNILASTVLVRCMNRRTLFVISETISFTSILILGGYFYIRDNNEKDVADALGWLPLISLVGFIAGIGIGVSPLCWVVSNEVLPPKFKSLGSSITSFTYWMSAFTVTKTFVDIERVFTAAGAFWFYGCVCVVGLLFGIAIMPETKGKTPAQIQAIFSKN